MLSYNSNLDALSQTKIYFGFSINGEVYQELKTNLIPRKQMVTFPEILLLLLLLVNAYRVFNFAASKENNERFEYIVSLLMDFVFEELMDEWNSVQWLQK